MNVFRILISLCLAVCGCECYKILAVFPVPSHSHYILNYKLVEELAIRGHEVTFFTPYPRKNALKNLKEISLESIINPINEEKKHLLDLESYSVLKHTQFVSKFGCIYIEKTLENEDMQKLLLSNQQFDIIILPEFSNPGLLALGHHFQAPVILFATMPLFSWSSFRLGDPRSSSYFPNIVTEYAGKMNFWQRFSNTFSDVISILYDQFLTLPKHQELVKKYIPGSPDLYQFLNNHSLVLINSHMSSFEAFPQIPNFVEIGGFHIEENKTLPRDLQNFLDKSTNGVVLFSMGSNLKSSTLPKAKWDAILSAFGKLKQNVLLKWETDDLPGKPPNVKIMKWIPQTDILAHSNVKAFISHGGLLSTMESLYRGVPVVGIPIFADQKMNIALACRYGYATKVDFRNLTEENLLIALNSVLNNDRYKENVKKRSAIMKDRDVNPRDAAVYWIEYVARHKDALHLKYPGADLTWFQRHLLDVYAFTILILFISLFSVYVVIKKSFRIIFKQQRKFKNE